MTANNQSEDLEKIFDFFHISEKLKKAFRYSTINYAIKDSSAEHSWHLSLMVFIIAKELNLKIDVEYSLKIAIVHDIAESITGDIDYALIIPISFLPMPTKQLEISLN